jgi:hypothetical protein
MPSIRGLLDRIRPRPYVQPTTGRELIVRRAHVEPNPDPAPTRAPECPRNDHHATAVRPVRVDESPRSIRVSPAPPEPSPRCEPTPDLAPTAPPASPVDGPRVSKLAALTPVLGRRKAGQALWAPEKLTPAERRTADRILQELDRD